MARFINLVVFVAVVVLAAFVSAQSTTPAALQPHTQPDLFPWADWDFHPSAYAPGLAPEDLKQSPPERPINSPVLYSIRFNVERIETPEQAEARTGSIELLRMEFDYALGDASSPKCWVSAPGKTTSWLADMMTISELETFLSYLSGFNAGFPRELADATRLKIACYLYSSSSKAVQDVPLFTVASHASVPLPLFDEIAKVTFTAGSSSSWILSRALKQSTVEARLTEALMLSDSSATPGEISTQVNQIIGDAVYIDEEESKPTIEFLPLDGRPYLLDFSIDSRQEFIYFHIPTRSWTINYHLSLNPDPIDYPSIQDPVPINDLEPVFRIIPNSFKCEGFAESPIKTVDLPTAAPGSFGKLFNYGNVIGFEVTQAGAYSCSALVIAQDVPFIYKGYSPAGDSGTEGGEDDEASIQDALAIPADEFPSFIFVNAFHSATNAFPTTEIPWEVTTRFRYPFITGVYVPIDGTSVPGPSPEFAIDISKTAFPTNYHNPSDQISQYQLLETATWSLSQQTSTNSQRPDYFNWFTLTITAANLPRKLLSNALFHVEPFHMTDASQNSQSPILDRALSGGMYQTSNLYVNDYAFDPSAVTDFDAHHWPTRYPYISALFYPEDEPTWSFTEGSGPESYSVEFHYPVYKHSIPLDPDVDCSISVERAVHATYCNTMYPAAPDLSRWNQLAPGVRSTEFHLFVNGKLVTPSAQANPLKAIVTLTAPPLPVPQPFITTGLYLEDDGVYTPLDVTVPISSGSVIYFVVKTQVGAPLRFVASGSDFKAVFRPATRQLDGSDAQLFAEAGWRFTPQECTVDNKYTVALSTNGGNTKITWSLIKPTGRVDNFQFINEAKECHFRILITGTSPRPFLIGNAQALQSTLLALPQIIRDNQYTVGIQPTRPFFLNQINFGSIRITNIPLDVEAITFLYRGVSFRNDETTLSITCNDPNDVIYPATLQSIGDPNGVAQIAILLSETARETIVTEQTPSLVCPGIPLFVQNFRQNPDGTVNRAGLQAISAGQKTLQTRGDFPPLYVSGFKATLTPGRISTINFNVTSSIPGSWLIKSPYGVDPLADNRCLSPAGETLMDVVYHDEYSYTDEECKELYDEVDDAEGYQSCLDADPLRLVFRITSHFNENAAVEGKYCLFSATRRYSTPPGLRSTATLSFPRKFDKTLSQIEQPLFGYSTGLLFPAIGSLPATVDIQINDTQDALTLDVFNVKIATGAKLVLTHNSPLDADTVTGAVPLSCSVYSDSLGVVHYDGSDVLKTIVSSTLVTTPATTTTEAVYTYTMTFSRDLDIFEFLKCQLPLNYAGLEARKAQTASAAVPVSFGTTTDVGDFTTFVYLPPITSKYELSFIDGSFTTSTVTSSTFGIKIKNTGGKSSTSNSLFVRFTEIGLVPFDDKPESTATCTIDTVQALTTSYTRHGDYVLRIDLEDFTKTVDVEYIINCTLRYSKPEILTKSSSAKVYVTFNEGNSGQFGLISASTTFTPPTLPPTGVARLFLKFLSPSIANPQQSIVSSLYPAQVGTLLSTLKQLFQTHSTAPIPGLTAQGITSEKATAFVTSIEKFLGNEVTLILRQANLRRITNLNDEFAKTGVKLDKINIEDISSVLIPTASELTESDVRLVNELFNPTAWWWFNSAEVLATRLTPFDASSIQWHNNWPAVCITGNYCGLGCPQLCPLTIACDNDFHCASGFCKPGEKNTASVCAIKDFSSFDADFFIEYTKK